MQRLAVGILNTPVQRANRLVSAAGLPVASPCSPQIVAQPNVVCDCAAPADAVLDYLDSKNWGLHTLQIPQQFKFDHLTVTQQLDQGEPPFPGILNFAKSSQILRICAEDGRHENGCVTLAGIRNLEIWVVESFAISDVFALSLPQPIAPLSLA